jgi:hypothetical protein
MPELVFSAIVQRQLRLLQHICDTLTMRALAGQRADLDSLFLAQEHLEHWLQYLTPLALDVEGSALDAPPPLPSMRPAPPLPHEEEIFTRAREAMERQAALDGLEPQRPHVTFPPDPLWAEELEREREDER